MAKVCSSTGCALPVFSKGLCQRHWRPLYAKPIISKAPASPKVRKPIKRSNKPIAKKSAKRKADDVIYFREREKFLAGEQECELKLEGCVGVATEVHHLYSGKNRDKYYLVVATWKRACASCHFKTHNLLSMEEAIALGLKLTE